MMLLVDVDNYPAICLYESLGFAKVQGQNNLTAHWTVPRLKREHVENHMNRDIMSGEGM